MTIYVEGKRSFDGRLLPFKKGPFYLAEECRCRSCRSRFRGREEVMPKARFAHSAGDGDGAVSRSDRAGGFRQTASA